MIALNPEAVSGLVAVAPVEIARWMPSLSGSTVPTLGIWGENDSVVPLREGERLCANMADCRLEVLAGAGHPCYLDAPDRFHALLLEFAGSL